MLLQYLVYPFYGIESTYSHRNQLYHFENFRMLVYIHKKRHGTPVPRLFCHISNTIFVKNSGAAFRQYRTKSVWRLCTPSACKFPVIFHKNAREYIKYSLRFLFHLAKNLTTHLSHNLCAVLPNKPHTKSRIGNSIPIRLFSVRSKIHDCKAVCVCSSVTPPASPTWWESPHCSVQYTAAHRTRL